MNIIRNILAVIIGAIVGGVVNSGIIGISGDVIPLPEGVDPNDIESIKAGMASYEPIHYLMPFLAHALGTLVGAIVTALIAASHKLTFALVIGGLFLIGGIMMVFMLPSPLWFNIVDIVFAYLPMGWLGWKIASSWNK